MTLGSLFDGSGGFPLAGVLNGIEPVWSSEIEAYPLRVTAARFPNVKQLGDVTKINGAKIEPVDIITFGSPCQDLSVAGNQLGIHKGDRSNLFFEAIRIIKEMRNRDKMDGRTGVDIRPRWAVWENVPGAFNSNKGEDFRAVLEAFASICQNGLSIPKPKKWNHSGCVVGNGWSVAWRVYDAQYWGLPQRRKRIYLIAGFASERSGEILFERESVSRGSSESAEKGQGATEDAEGSVGGSGKCLNPWDVQSKHIMTPDCKSEALCAGEKRWGDLAPNVCYALQGNGIDRADTARCNGCGWRTDQMYTLNTIDRPAVCFQQNQRDEVRNMGEQSGSLLARPGSHNQNYICYSLDRAAFNQGINAKYDISIEEEKAASLVARGPCAVCYANHVQTQENPTCFAPKTNFHSDFEEADVSATLETKYHYGSDGDAALVCYDARGNGDGNTVPTLTGDHQNRITDYTAICIGNGQLHQTDLGEVTGALNCMHDQQAIIQKAKPPRKYIVRRLTPLECCRLQGFPDWWEDGVEGSDSARYKMWGNGIALPCAVDVPRRIKGAE